MKAKQPTDDDNFNRGLSVFIQWGPERARPIEQRLAEALPSHSAAQIAQLIKDYGRIESTANQIVTAMVEARQPEAEARRRVAEIDPRLSADNAAHLFTQARYWAWKDECG